jgi:hypothetical protein
MPNGVALGDLPGIEQVELDPAGNSGTAGLVGLAGGKVSGLLGFPRTGPVRAVAGEEAGQEDLGQERDEGEVGLVRGESRDGGGRGGQGVREADLVRGNARRVDGDTDDPADPRSAAPIDLMTRS